MGKAVSKDLRESVVAAYHRGVGTQPEVAELFGIGEASLRRWLRLERETGSLEPRTDFQHGPPPKVQGASLVALETLLAENPDATNAELADLLADRTGVEVSASTISRAVTGLGWSRKKKTIVAKEGDDPRILELRAKWASWAPQVDPERLVFIDEAGSTISMTREYARSPIGERVMDKTPRNRGTVTTILGALTLDGLEATMTIEGGTSGDVYVAFLEQVLGPRLQEGDLVIMDNAGAHKDPRVSEVLARFGAKAVYLPPYSPHLNPIEPAWSKLKSFLRAAKARTVDALNTAIAMGASIITSADARGWFRHCGYSAQQT